MKTKIKKIKELLILLAMAMPLGTFAQTLFTENYSDATTWGFDPGSVAPPAAGISLGTNVMQYTALQGASIKRASKSLGTTLNQNQFRTEFTYTPDTVGSMGPGHYLMALTSGTQDPYYSSFTDANIHVNSIQDAIAITWISNNASNTESTFELRVSAKEQTKVVNIPANLDNTNYWVSSNPVILTNPYANSHRIILDRINATNFILTVVNATTNAFEGSTCLFLPFGYNISGLTTLQHGVYAHGGFGRELTAQINNFSISTLTVNGGSVGNATKFICGNAPSIIDNFAGATVNGENIPLVGPYSYSYQWQENSPNSAFPNLWTDIVGATSPTYTPANVSQYKKYRRKVISTCLGTALPIAYSNVVTVRVSTPIIITPQVIRGAKCACDGQALVTVSGGLAPYTYNWSHNANFHASSSTTLCAGDYIVTVIDANGCSNQTNLHVNEIDLSTITAVSVQTNSASCGTNGGAIVTSVTNSNGGPYSYSWDNAANTLINSINGLSVGVHNVNVTSPGGCSYNEAFTIYDGRLSINPVITAPNCQGTNAGITIIGSAFGTYSYVWTGPSFVTPFTTNSATISNLTPGTYNVSVSVTVPSGVACNALATVVVPSYTLDATVTNTSANAPVCDATASLNIITGTAPLVWNWYKINSLGQGIAINTTGAMSLSNLCSGNYYIKITDACKNVITRYFTIADAGIDPRMPINNSANVEMSTPTISCFPSPAKDELNIKLEQTESAIVAISLYDLTGREVMKIKEGVITAEVIKINITELPKGVYLLRSMVNNIPSTKKVIISK